MIPGRAPGTVEQVVADVRAAAFQAGASPVILVDRTEGIRRG
ncbi:hypothetical protein [Streptomyces sp. NPDC054794]